MRPSFLLIIVIGILNLIASPASGMAVRTRQNIAPPFMRTSIMICISNSRWGPTCSTDWVNEPLHLAVARHATIQIRIDAYVTGEGPIPPLDMAPHVIRMAVIGAFYAGDGPGSLLHTWIGSVRGHRIWSLRRLVTLPSKEGEANLFEFSISVDGWPAGSCEIHVVP